MSTEVEVDGGAWYDVGAGEVEAAVGAIDNTVNVVGVAKDKKKAEEAGAS